LIERPFVVGAESSTARIYQATTAPCQRTLVLAHGAGAPQAHPFMVAFAEGLAARGIDVVTFDFLYAAAQRRLPDRSDKLEACWLTVARLARAEWPDRVPFVGGKSMGGRIASQLVAAGTLAARGLVLLGYPLAPPKKPHQLRAAHLSQLSLPTLVVQGERDEFGGPAELRRHFPAAAEIMSVRGGHSFDERAWPEAIARVAEFIGRLDD
jgi:predicted alpha/beta-hydrolase family hydrolase